MERLEKAFPNITRYVLSILLLLPVLVLVFMEPALGNTIIIFTIWGIVIFAGVSFQLKLINLMLPVVFIPLIFWGVVKPLSFLDGEVASIITVILVVAIAILLALKSRIKWYFIILAILLGFLIKPAFTLGWDSGVIGDYQKQRVETFFSGPESDPQDAGYQVKQSKVAIGSGRFWGRGFLQGTQSSLKVLPYAHTDFIFASLAEQFGYFGTSIILLLYIVVLLRIVQIGITAGNEFGFLICIGIAALILINLFINIGMNMGKLPVTGIPLPLLSYGGSSVLVNMIGIGFVQAVNSNRRAIDIAESLTPSDSPWR